MKLSKSDTSNMCTLQGHCVKQTRCAQIIAMHTHTFADTIRMFMAQMRGGWLLAQFVYVRESTLYYNIYFARISHI